MLDVDSVSSDRIYKRYDIVVESKEKPEEIAAKFLPKDPTFRKIAEDVVFMKNKVIEEDVRTALRDIKPEDIIEEGLIKGMDIVGELYGRGIYYLPHVMVAADAMDKGVKICERSLRTERKVKGSVVMHVAEGDPHDIGKNIAAVLVRSNGYRVVDLGRDVPVDEVVKAVEEKRPDALTGTALMTTTMSAFPKIASLLVKKGIELPFICAGGAVNRAYVESYPLGIYAQRAIQGPLLVGKAVEGVHWKDIRARWDRIKAGAE